MTSRQLYEGVLIELNKENAPNILLEDFNYFANKAINNYVNKRYNIYDVNQQTTDDLRVLKATALLTPTHVNDYTGLTMAGDGNMATYEVILPSDYLHILNCICIYNVKKTYKCYNRGDTWRAAATRLTADMYSQVLDNFWNKPTYKKPYYYIHNVNTSNIVPTNPYTANNENNSSNSNSIVTLVQCDNSPILYAYYNEKLYYFSEEGGDSNDYLIYNSSKGLSSIATMTQREGQYYFPSLSISRTPVSNAQMGVFNMISRTTELKVGNKVIKILNGAYQDLVSDNILQINSSNISQIFSKLKTGTDVNSISTESGNKGGRSEYPSTGYDLDGNNNQIVQGKGLPNTIDLLDPSTGNTYKASNVERGQALRYGNVSQVRLEIRYGQ